MGYRLRYQVWVDWLPAGLGPGLSNPTGPGAPGGPAQTLAFFNSQGQVSGASYPPTSSTFLNADVANLLTSMTTDLTAQMENAAVQTRIQNFSTGTG